MINELRNQIVRNEYACHLLREGRRELAKAILVDEVAWSFTRDTLHFSLWHLKYELRNLFSILIQLLR